MRPLTLPLFLTACVLPAAASSPAPSSPSKIVLKADAAATSQSEAAAEAPTPTPAPSPTTKAPAGFDPMKFGTLTTDTLPMDNGHRIVMRVNDRPVIWEDFAAQARLAGSTVMGQYPGHENNVMAALSSPVMDALVLQELYRQYADEHTITVQPAEIQKRVTRIQSSGNLALARTLSMLTKPQLARLATDALIHEKVDKYIGDRATSEPASMTEITSFTVGMRPTTSPVELTRARHIVIRATPDMSEFNTNDAKAHAEEVLDKIHAGLPFEVAAHEYSQDRFTAYLDGDVGYYEPGQMYDSFEKAAAKLKPGEVSGVVRTPVGFHIIKVTERYKDNLRLLLDKYRRRNAIEQWKQKAGGAAKVERYLGAEPDL